MLDLARLRALHAVHTHGSVGAAATALGYTPSAVSQQITKLERETRTTLLERQGRGVALTDAAQLLVATAQQLLSIVEEAEVALEEQRGRPAGRLTVAAFPTAARGLLPGVLARLTAEHPSLDLRLVEEDPHRSVELVARGVVDLAVAHDWDIAPLPAPEGLERAAIGEDPCDVLVPAGHALATRPGIVRDDLLDARWICQPPGTVCHDWLLRTLRSSGAEPEVAYHVAEYQTQLALVAAGLGIALVPRLGRGPLPEEVTAVPLDPTPVRGLFALWRTGASRRPAITETVRVLREHWPPRSW
ncbi:LysR family transcriptional regulator [Actinacidiphila oryziradicis]|jgi:DNA-binding transcriptional LysR family regulator|uniref:LysR family transcriptional regulator n=1 Tax=Actinacidiphila oryziradicis TaxID=2571141 RepID=UPI0023F572AE|nr:LysR family transcriptional regulator [Actinacidiphila oryziradicis]MCW2873494.1 putative LysR-family transcriptional regulator [Actinacidiphila oryziradicis]